MLHLDGLRWEGLTERQWEQWELIRQDKKLLHLFEIQMAAWNERVSGNKGFEKAMAKLKQVLGARPDLTMVFPPLPTQSRARTMARR